MSRASGHQNWLVSEWFVVSCILIELVQSLRMNQMNSQAENGDFYQQGLLLTTL